MIINYQPSAVNRSVGKITSSETTRKMKLKFAEKLAKFFGTDEWRDCTTEEQFRMLYVSRIESYKERVISIKVAGSESFYYYILVAVRRTKGSQRWIDAIYDTQERIENITSTDIKNLLKVYSGKQQTLF